MCILFWKHPLLRHCTPMVECPLEKPNVTVYSVISQIRVCSAPQVLCSGNYVQFLRQPL